MRLLDIQHDITKIMARFVAEVKSATAMGLSDINRVAETVLIPLLGSIYDCPQLENLNIPHPNHPAVDLGDATRRIAFQVTATPDSKKIKDTLTTFIRHTLHTQFDMVYVYILTEKQRSYTPAHFDAIVGTHIPFDPKIHILDANDLLKKIAAYHVDKAQHILTILEANFDTPIDPLAQALATYRALPIDVVPAPRSDLPQASRLPFEANPHFVGREIELKALAIAMSTTQPAVVLPAIATGLGGIGKTSLATEFAYRYGVYFHGGVFWLTCADPDQMANQVAACAVDLGIDTTGIGLDEQVQRVLNAWKSPMPRLLIFDNCDDPAILQQWKPTVGGCRVLVTSRSDQWTRVTQIRLELLSPTESRTLLQALCSRLSDVEADAIAHDVGHLPLALHLAGSYLQVYTYYTTAEYRKKLNIAHQSLKGRGALPSPTRHEQDVEATFMLSFNRLDPTNTIDALALKMLDSMAWCVPGIPIPRDLALRFVYDESDVDDAVDALRRLQQLGLLDGIDEVVLHRLLAQVIHTRLGSQEILEIVEIQIDEVMSWGNNNGDPRALRPIEEHLRYITLRALDRADLLSIRLANNLAHYEINIGLYGAAQSLLERIVDIQQNLDNPDINVTVTIMNNLALVFHHQALYINAQDWYYKILNTLENLEKKDNKLIAETKNNLAMTLSHQRLYTEAEIMLNEAIILYKNEIENTKSIILASMLNNLVSILEKQAFYKDAEVLYKESLEMQEDVPESKITNILSTKNNLALVFIAQDRYDEAEMIFKYVLEARKQILGIDHAHTAQSMNNLGIVLEKKGYNVEAYDLHMDALSIRKNRLGDIHPDTIESMSNLASVCIKLEKYTDAHELYEQMLKWYKQQPEAIALDAIMIMNNLAVILELQQFYSQAYDLYKQVLVLCTHRFGIHDVRTQNTQETLKRLKRSLS